MLLSILIVVFIAAYAFRGWRRGLVVEVVELVGLVGGILAAYLIWPAIRAVLSGWLAAFGGLVVFAAVFGLAVLVARWAARYTHTLPVGGRMVDGAGGSVFASAWSLILVTGLLILGLTVPGTRVVVARPVCTSPVAEALVSQHNPLHVGGERLATLARPALLWINQQLMDGGFTLSHDGSLCANLPAEPPPGVPGRGVAHVPFTFPPARPAELAVAPGAEDAIHDLLNRARADQGLRPLAADEPLRNVARAHSRDMYLRGYFAHETPECRRGRRARGCTGPFQRMRRAGISFLLAGENLALAPTPEAAHAGLMDSPGHRANILHADFRRVGIGVYRGPYGLMVSQEFTG